MHANIILLDAHGKTRRIQQQAGRTMDSKGCKALGMAVKINYNALMIDGDRYGISAGDAWLLLVMKRKIFKVLTDD